MTGRPGFTLLELAVALLIAAAVTTVGAAALGQALDSIARSRTGDAAFEAAAARRNLIGWLAGAHLDPDQQVQAFKGIDRTFSGMDDDELSFFTTAAFPYSPGGTHVRLYIDRNVDGSGLVAELLAPGDSAARRIIVVPGATGLDGRYLLRTTQDHRWLHGWVSSVELPRGVRLTVTGGQDLPLLFQLPVVIPLRGTL